ncbi:MAG TPA: STAS domain-containing protein [Solirubrobacteraceae bacterium]|nr:STAS domain-containing protein [Solirubrobacteraceae bacterium]
MTEPDRPLPAETAARLSLERAATRAGDVPVLVLVGELDLASAGRFRELAEEAAADAPGMVVADVSEVTFMDSTMLRELLRGHRELAEQGSRLVVAGAQASVRRLLELTGTDRLFALAETREQALGTARSAS